QIADQVVLAVENGDPGAQLGNEQEIAAGGKTTGAGKHTTAKYSLKVPLDIIDLNSPVAAVGDVQFGLIFAIIHHDPVRAFERTGLTLAAVDTVEIITGLVVGVDIIRAVSIRHPDLVVAALA